MKFAPLLVFDRHTLRACWFCCACSVPLDTTVPPVLDSPLLALSSDSGRSDIDHVTNDTTPTFSGEAETLTSNVTLYNRTSVNGPYKALGWVLATANSSSETGFSYTLTPTVALVADTYDLYVQAEDLAGNLGPMSAAGVNLVLGKLIHRGCWFWAHTHTHIHIHTYIYIYIY